MIKLELQGGYCHNCRDFEADVEKPIINNTVGDPYFIGDTTYVRCAYRKICGRISNHIETAIRKEYEDRV